MSRSDDGNAQGQPQTSRPRRVVQVVAVGLVLVSGLAGIFAARWLKPVNLSQGANPIPVAPEADPSGGITIPKHLFRGWEKPELVLVLTGSQHGYLLPCGCSHPQYGGLERRYNFVQALRDRGWTVAAVDVGDIPQMRGPRGLANVQGLIKYRHSMSALKIIGYSAVTFGEYEAAMPLNTALGEYALNDPVPRVLAANLTDVDNSFPGMVDEWLEIKNLPIKTGVTACIGNSVAQKIKDSSVKIEFTGVALKRVLPKMRTKGIELRILLYQGLATNRLLGPNAPRPEAIQCVQAFPEFQVVLALGEEDEPSARPILENNGNTLIASLGYKGRHIGVVGVWRTGIASRPFRLEYQLVEMGEEFATPKEQAEGHPIITLIEEYTAELKRKDILDIFAGQTTKHRLQIMDPVKGLRKDTPAIPEYVGSEKCKTCHAGAYAVWKGTKHSQAYQTLVDARRPSNRQYDAECIVCHTTGFGYHSGFTSPTNLPNLKDVGCESCHGPGSHHVKNPRNQEWQARMNEWKAPENETPAQQKKRRGRIADFCTSCHDIDNDVTWIADRMTGTPALDRKWHKIAHTKE